MNVVQEINRLNEKELARGTGLEGSWHDQYKDSAWVYVGGLDVQLSEGDVLCVMSQWGEVEDIHLVRDKGTGKSKGFAFLKYEDQRSTVLAVDNFNGVKLLERTLRVDHKAKYALPKEIVEKEEQKEKEALERGEAPEDGPRWRPGHAYEGKEVIGQHDLKKGVDLFAKQEESGSESEEGGYVSSVGKEGEGSEEREARRKRKEERKRLKKEKKRAKKEAKKQKRKREEAGEGEEKEKGHGATNGGGKGEESRQRRRGGSRSRSRDGGRRDRRSGSRDRPPRQYDRHHPSHRRRSRSRSRSPPGGRAWDRSEGFREAAAAAAKAEAPLPPDAGAAWRGRYDPAAQQAPGGPGGPSRGGGGGRGAGFGGGGRGGGFATGGRGGGSMFGRAFGGKPGSLSGVAGLNRRR